MSPTRATDERHTMQRKRAAAAAQQRKRNRLARAAPKLENKLATVAHLLPPARQIWISRADHTQARRRRAEPSRRLAAAAQHQPV
jgi:hypothetical protein